MKEPLVEPEPPHVTVARRLRGKMGEQQLSQDAICKIVGWNRGYMHRRYVGETALDVNDLEALEMVGISKYYLLTGVTECPADTRNTNPNPSEAVTGSSNGLPDPIEYLRNRVHMTTTTKPRAAGIKLRHSSLLPRVDSGRKPVGYRLSGGQPRAYRCPSR
jgi:hypothetical protein